MNRRSFFKAVTGFVAGIFAAKSKAKDWHFVVATYNGSDGIELNPHRMERLRIEAAEKAAKPTQRGYKKYYVRYDFDTKVQTVIEDGEITKTRKFKEDPFVLFNPDPTIRYVIFERYKFV